MTENAKRTGPAVIQRGGQTVLWIIAVLLGMVASAMWTRMPAGGLLPTALAQNQPGAGARGIFAFTGQIDHNRFGLFMLDVDQGTIWCYEIDNTSGGSRKLRLVAARTFIYDRYLKDFNCDYPNFRVVQKLVEQQRDDADAETGTDLSP